MESLVRQAPGRFQALGGAWEAPEGVLRKPWEVPRESLSKPLRRFQTLGGAWEAPGKSLEVLKVS